MFSVASAKGQPSHRKMEIVTMNRAYSFVRCVPYRSIIVTFFVLLMLARVGLIPSSSSGDDVWFSESAYWLLKDGVLRSDIHQDNIGSFIRDFLPPVPALFQSVSFSIFGINQYSMNVAPTIALLLSILMTLCVRLTGGRHSFTFVAASALAPFVIPDAVRYSLQVRFDIYVALCVNFALLLMYKLSKSSNKSTISINISTFIIGACLSFSIISYYQFFPVALILLICGLIIQGRAAPANIGRVLLIVGAAVPTFVFLIWIGGDIVFFLKQNLALASGYQFANRMSFGFYSSTVIFEASICVIIAVICLIVVIRMGALGRIEANLRLLIVGLFIANIVCSIMSVFAFRGMILCSALISSHIIYLTFEICSNVKARNEYRRRASLKIAILLMGSLGFVNLTAFSVLGLFNSARNYAIFGHEIVNSSNLEGVVLFDNPAWLALRELVPAGSLVHIVGMAPDAAALNKSTIFEDRSYSKNVTSVIIREGNASAYIAKYPLLKAFLERKDVVGPIHVGYDLPYKVEIYTVGRKK